MCRRHFGYALFSVPHRMLVDYRVPQTGAMGMRTIHQQDAKAQLTVQLRDSSSGDGSRSATENAGRRRNSGVDCAALDAMLEGGAGEAELKVTKNDVWTERKANKGSWCSTSSLQGPACTSSLTTMWCTPCVHIQCCCSAALEGPLFFCRSSSGSTERPREDLR